MDEKKASFLLFEKELKSIQSRDNIKNVVASADFARKIVSQLSFDAVFDAKNFLVVSDSVLLLTLLERLHGYENGFKNVTFLCHTKEVEEYVRETFGIKTWFVPYENLKNDFFAMNTNIENDYNFNGMKFDCIIGNPPYNGISKKDVPKEIACDLTSGYNTYYAFILKSISLLQEGGELIFVTPREWLCSKGGRTLREKILSECCLSNIKWESNPWGDEASTGVVSIFKLDKKGKRGTKQLLVNGGIPCIKSKLDLSILSKITSFLQKFKAVEFFVSKTKEDETCEEREWVSDHTYGKQEVKITRARIRTNEQTEDAIKRNKAFIVYPEFGRYFFKAHKAIVKPMPVRGDMLVVPTNTPKKHAALLESNVAIYTHMACYSSRHLTSLQGYFPDVTSLLSDEPTQEEIYDVFGLSQEEREHVKNVAATHGKDN